MNKFFLGNNLEVLETYIQPNSIDMVYLDPPFNSKSDYFIFKDGKKQRIFNDTWENNIIDNMTSNKLDKFICMCDASMSNYLLFLAPRLVSLHKVMKDTGVIFLHCDSSASHYIKVVLDLIFDRTNFINSVTIKRPTAHNDAKRHLGRISDYILIYGKSSKHNFQNQYIPYTDEYIKTKFNLVEDDGRKYATKSLWTTLDFNKARPFGKFEWQGIFPTNRSEWAYSKENMDKLYAEGKIVFNKNGKPVIKYYLEDMHGKILQDIWDDVSALTKSERCNYPTQKSLKLLNRVVSLGSSEGDTVLDPFCGSGTTLVAAQENNRRWIGIDNQEIALEKLQMRLSSNNFSIIQI